MRLRTVWVMAAMAILAAGPLRAADKEPASANVQASPAPTDNHYLKFWREFLQGEWTTKIVEAENEGRLMTGATGTWSSQLGPTKTCMLFLGTINGKSDDSGVGGYDPRAKAWKEVFFMADGSHLIQLYRAAPDTLSGDPVGKILKGHAEYISPDGKVEKSDIQVKILGLDTCEYSVTNRRTGEQKRPDLRISYERKKK
jgi:hypothetical protein